MSTNRSVLVLPYTLSLIPPSLSSILMSDSNVNISRAFPYSGPIPREDINPSIISYQVSYFLMDVPHLRSDPLMNSEFPENVEYAGFLLQ